jgi:antirestriction protein ArdC
MTNKVYDLVTQHVLAQLAKGTVPWRKPWGLGPGMYPINATNNKPYKGINAWMLGMTSYSDTRWLTYKQAQERGGHVRKGEKATAVIFWKVQTIEEEKEGEIKEKNIPVLRYYSVFNALQCDGLKLPALANNAPIFEPIERAESIIAGMPHKPPVGHDGGDKAYYVPLTDSVHLPPKSAFDNADEYYSTLFHEQSHSTGHSSRLNRSTLESLAPFGSQVYSKEELVAEFAAAFLCQESGITNTLDNSTAYITGWVKKIGSDKTLVVHGASQAQKAFEYILGQAI